MRTRTSPEHARCHRPRLAGAPAHRDRARVFDRPAGIGGAGLGAVRCVSGFRAAARAGADRGARPRCDASRGSGHEAARGSSCRHRERENGALDLEPGPLGDAGGVRPQRRSLSAAPSGHRAPRRDCGRTARGNRRAAPLAFELLDGVPGALRLHQRPAVGRGAARHRAMDREAADPRRTGRRAGADLRREPYASGRSKSIRSSSPRLGSRWTTWSRPRNVPPS